MRGEPRDENLQGSSDAVWVVIGSRAPLSAVLFVLYFCVLGSIPRRIGNNSVCRSSSTSTTCSSPNTGFTAVCNKSSSTQCSTSIGAFCGPAQVSVTLAKKGLSVVLEITKGGPVIRSGVAKVDGGGSVIHVTVNLAKKADICKD